ncbi:family 10 glycosylhydrolase [Pedobacter immunditicola]|uniref:family 10 glycosylhydrolase n=1 Tax=Pedobacter immunditicola TaxID=3133440 RepID=UPI0030B53141
MKNIIYTLFVFLLAGPIFLSACKKSNVEDPTGPVEPPILIDTTTRRGEAIAWVDARSNVFGTYGRFNDTAKISLTLDTLKSVGVTGLVLDVKMSTGYTMYPSEYSTQVTSMDGKTFTPGVDYVGFMIAAAKKRNLKVYASIITFVEGSANKGKVYEDPIWRDQYQSVVMNESGKRVPIVSTGKNGFVNPAIPQVQERALNIIKEILTKYEVDGLILDYARYTDINADFSDFSKNDFIKFLEQKYGDSEAKRMSFPSDIVTSWKVVSGQVVPNATGKYYKRWLLYRATVIHDFFVKAKAAVKSVKPAAKFGVYVGAWYTTYYQVGVNWASQEFDPFNDTELRFDWSYPDYNKTGYAEQLDLLMTGNYFTQLMIKDNPASANLAYHWWSVEGSLKGTKYITKNKMPLYGSIDMGNVDWPDQQSISKTIQYIKSNASGGVMLFDVVHVYAPQYNRLKQPLWNALREGLKK